MRQVVTVFPTMRYMDAVGVLTPAIVEVCFRPGEPGQLIMVVPIPDRVTEEVLQFLFTARARNAPVRIVVEVVDGVLHLSEHVVLLAPSAN